MLRFGRSYITVSEIAQQFFCEYKLHMAINEGKVETPSMEVGIVIHDEVFKGKSVDATEFLNIVRNNPVVIATLPLVVGIGDVVIVGIPDAVLFINGIAKAVIELKTSNKWLDRVFENENVQAQLYAYLINKLGLGRDPLIVIIKSKRDPGVVPSLRKSIYSAVVDYVNSAVELPAKVRFRDFTMYIDGFDRSIEARLRWALDYWLMRRDVQATPSPGKCSVCEYRGNCPFKALG